MLVPRFGSDDHHSQGVVPIGGLPGHRALLFLHPNLVVGHDVRAHIRSVNHLTLQVNLCRLADLSLHPHRRPDLLLHFLHRFLVDRLPAAKRLVGSDQRRPQLRQYADDTRGFHHRGEPQYR